MRLQPKTYPGQSVRYADPAASTTAAITWFAVIRAVHGFPGVGQTASADNYATHKHPVVQDWLAKYPRITMHFTPTSASWLNMVERFFRDITTERLRRGVFTSVPELIGAIDEYIAHHNTKPKPFIWTKSARDILQKVIRAQPVFPCRSAQNAELIKLYNVSAFQHKAQDMELHRMRKIFSTIRGIDFNASEVTNIFRNWIPIVFGLWSVALGEDANWDLYNYHLYNAFAFLNGKLLTDFAPAGLQSYFNPALDIPYFLAISNLPPVVVGFAMGAFHGLSFVVLLRICQIVLADLPPQDRLRIPLFLALAGCLTANFLSELGNTMGDNTTALIVLSGLLLALRAMESHTDSSNRQFFLLFVSGIVVGIASGLKPTNVVYATAMCAMLLFTQTNAVSRFRYAFGYGIGVLIGFGIAAGYWLFIMWSTFGNPLFPQFGSYFPNSLSASVAVADTYWIPQGIVRQILWPFIISADATAAGQLPMRQVIWAFVYILAIAFASKLVWSKLTHSESVSVSPAQKSVLAFLVLGFILWMKLFGVYRYLVAIELLAPLAIYVLLKATIKYQAAYRTGLLLIGTSVAVVIFGGVATWDHHGWTNRPFYAEVPPMSDPQKTTVVISEGNPAWAWLSVSFPPEVAFTQIAGNFPRGPNYKQHIGEMVERRGGQAFTVFHGNLDLSQERAERIRNTAKEWGLTRTYDRCHMLAWFVHRLRGLRAEVKMSSTSTDDCACSLESTGTRDENIDIDNQKVRDNAAITLEEYGFTMNASACTLHRSGIGDQVQVFQWCPIQRVVIGNKQS